MRLSLALEPQKRDIPQLKLLHIRTHPFQFLILLTDERGGLFTIHLAAKEAEEALFPCYFTDLFRGEVFFEEGVGCGAAFDFGGGGGGGAVGGGREFILLDILDRTHQHLALPRLQPRMFLRPRIIHLFNLLCIPTQPNFHRRGRMRDPTRQFTKRGTGHEGFRNVDQCDGACACEACVGGRGEPLLTCDEEVLEFSVDDEEGPYWVRLDG